MTPKPSGRLISTADGRTLIISRTFRTPIEDVWASLTESERTARWIGPWTGEGKIGQTVQVQMTVEEGAPASPATITACDPPRSLALDIGFEGGGVWRLHVDLREENGITTVELRHPLTEEDDASDIGPGWECYFDRLVASESGGEMREWDEYYLGMKGWYEVAEVVEG